VDLVEQGWDLLDMAAQRGRERIPTWRASSPNK